MKRNASVAVLGIFFATAARAGDVEPEPVLRMDDARTAPELPPLFMKANLSGPRLTADAMTRHIMRRDDMGSGGDVIDLFAVQILYGDAKLGNSLDLAWDETAENPSGVDVFKDGVRIRTAPGLPPAELPGTNFTSVDNVPAGQRVFKVEAEDTVSEVTMTVLDVKPFAEPTNIQCKSSLFVSPETGLCSVEVSWAQAEPEPDFYSIFLNDVFQGNWVGGLRGVILLDAPAGPYEVAVRAAGREHANSFYSGDVFTTNCDITCEDGPCNPVTPPDMCQIGYGTEPPGNELQLEWLNGETAYAAGVNVLVDGRLVGTTGPQSRVARVSGLMAGERKVGLQGDCGPDGKAAVQEKVFPVLESTPHPNPITGALRCSFDAGTAQTTVSWTPADPSAGGFIYLTREPNPPRFLGRVSNTATEVTINGAQETDTFSLIFIKFVDGRCYGSQTFSCSGGSSGPEYIQGVCNGEGAAPGITSAIFGLNWLFLSGATPPCQKACDVDGSGTVNITDMVSILNFLFLSGIPPSLWGGPNPVCSTAAPEDDCEIPNPACPI